MNNSAPDPCEIECNFEIPKEYEKTFVLNGDGWRVRMEVRGGKMRLHEHSSCHGHQSVCLNWIEETMERIRFECEQIIDPE